jgi:hypothetical protein
MNDTLCSTLFTASDLSILRPAGKLAVASEIRIGLPGSWINISWDQIEKICSGIGKLA